MSRSRLCVKLIAEWPSSANEQVSLTSPLARLFLSTFIGGSKCENGISRRERLQAFCSNLIKVDIGPPEDVVLYLRARKLASLCLKSLGLGSDTMFFTTVIWLSDNFPEIIKSLISDNLMKHLQAILLSTGYEKEASEVESFAATMISHCFTARVLNSSSSSSSSLIHLLTVPDLFSRYPLLASLSTTIFNTIGAAVSYACNHGGVWITDVMKDLSQGSRAALLQNLTTAVTCDQYLSLPPNQSTIYTAGGISILLRVISLVSSQGGQNDAMDVDTQESDGLDVAKKLWEDKMLLTRLITILMPLPSLSCSESEVKLAGDGAGCQALCLLLNEMVEGRLEKILRLPYLNHSMELIPRLWFNVLQPQSGTITTDFFSALNVQALFLFTELFLQQIALSDLGVFFSGRPLSLSELTSVILLLKEVLTKALYHSLPPEPVPQSMLDRLLTGKKRMTMRQIAEVASLLYKKLYELNSQRPFVSDGHFSSVDIPSERFFSSAVAALSSDSDLLMDESTSISSEAETARALRVLKQCPCLVPFRTRARIFAAVIEGERMTHNEAQNAAQVSRLERVWALEQSMDEDDADDDQRHQQRNQIERLAPSFIPIRRGSVLSDGFKNLKGGGEELKSRIRVQFFDSTGEAEPGIDGGGLFKDFIEEVLREGFSSPNLFTTNLNHEIFPNPDLPADSASRNEQLSMLRFIGTMTGKAVWEGILLNCRFAHFFLKLMAQAQCDFNDLTSLDETISRSLLRLRALPRDEFNSLGLFFTSNDDHELVPGGRSIPVTHDNVSDYVFRLSHYLLHGRTDAFRAFLSGFYSIIKPSLTLMFLPSELQLLLGGIESSLDLNNHKQSINYEGGYYEQHPIIQIFWEAVESFSEEERKLLIKFITSSSRAPLLGFQTLLPRISMVMAGGVLDPSIERLPTAATCMNLLKLPPYPNVTVMRSKLLMAITSGAGFDLS